MSPKDIKQIPIYDNYKIAYNHLRTSDRTKNIFDYDPCLDMKFHLFLREQRIYSWEARCFWSRDKLRAVSLPKDMDFSPQDKLQIIEFFNIYSINFPYHSATVDIEKYNNIIELIEFNTFGPDMNAIAGNFSWEEDAMTLLFSTEPVLDKIS